MIRSDMDMYAEDEAVVASGQVGDVIDHGDPRSGYDPKGVGSGAMPRYLNIVVKTAASESDSQQFVLESSDVENFATGVKTMATSPDIAVADLVKGAHFEVPVAAGGQQYTRVRSVNTGTTEDSLEVDLFTTY